VASGPRGSAHSLGLEPKPTAPGAQLPDPICGTRSPCADSARPADLVEEIAQPARDEDLLAGKERLRRDVHAIFVSLALSLWAS